jgi:hypothetical protein
MSKRVHKKRLGTAAKQTRDTPHTAKKTKIGNREKRETEFAAEEEIARALKDSNAGDDW